MVWTSTSENQALLRIVLKFIVQNSFIESLFSVPWGFKMWFKKPQWSWSLGLGGL